ncbi:MAG: phosphatidate cytidylyltransferase [Candidatus Coatesbacteria bacterium]
MSDLPRRAVAAVVAIPLLGWFLFSRTPYPFGAVIVVASLAGLREVFAMLRKLKFRPFEPVGYAAALACHAAALWEWNLPASLSILAAPVFLLTVILLALLLAMLCRGMEKDNVPSVAVTLFAALYAGWLASFVTRLRVLPEGAQWVFLLFVLTWTYDTAAYFWGVNFGGPKLWPSVSPKKTWAGLWGGIGTTLAILVALRHLLPAGTGPHLFPYPLAIRSLWWLVPVGCVMAQLGDLAESMLKRAAGVKDSGAFLPGHGGLLDKLDSFLFTGPLLYFLAVAVL